jgi:hypothetical protein
LAFSGFFCDFETAFQAAAHATACTAPGAAVSIALYCDNFERCDSYLLFQKVDNFQSECSLAIVSVCGTYHNHIFYLQDIFIFIICHYFTFCPWYYTISIPLIGEAFNI